MLVHIKPLEALGSANDPGMKRMLFSQKNGNKADKGPGTQSGAFALFCCRYVLHQIPWLAAKKGTDGFDGFPGNQFAVSNLRQV